MDPFEAAQIIQAMNSGKIQWDDNLRAKANNAMSGGGGGMFSFDYKAEAEKAYGELGAYYDRILKETEGDLDKALARMVEDYDRGIRIKRTTTDRSLQDTQRAVRDNALARGLYSRSAYDPRGGYGIPDAELERRQQPIKEDLANYEELYGKEGVYRKRGTEDTTTKKDRFKFEQEQRRREQAADLSNQRGARAFQEYQYRNLYNPSMI